MLNVLNLTGAISYDFFDCFFIVILIMSSGPGGYSSANDGMWSSNAGDERVKQILANLAREVEQGNSRKSGVSESRISPAPTGTFLAQAVGHDPADHIPSDYCFLGCTFFIAADYQQSFAPSEIESWSSTIRKLGGQVDQVYSTQVTHVLCSSQFLDAARAALLDVRRVVTAYWLADAVKSKRMNPPTRATHLPCPFMPPAYPLSNLLVAVTGFTGVDRMDARLLLAAVGAIYTTHMTPRHTVLVAAKASGAKYENAVKWNIPVVNAAWLKDIYFGNLAALKLPVAQQYVVKSGSDESYDSGNLLRLQQSDLTNVAHLFSPWKHYLKVQRDALKRRLGESQTPDDRQCNSSSFGHNVDSLHSADRDDVKHSNALHGPVVGGPPRVIITGFTAKASYDLARKVRTLGGQVLDSLSPTCTHLVAAAIIFTPKFLAALNCCRYIVAPEWIEASFMANTFLPESGFQLRDPVSERLYGCNLLLTHERAARGELFENLSFFVSPTIQPRPSVIRMLIATNGGTSLAVPPPADALLPKAVSQSDASESTNSSNSSPRKASPTPASVVIANPQDLPLFRDLYPPNVPIHSVEFILTACLRQELNFSDFIIPRS